MIITRNVKDFTMSQIPVLTPHEFLQSVRAWECSTDIPKRWLHFPIGGVFHSCWDIICGRAWSPPLGTCVSSQILHRRSDCKGMHAFARLRVFARDDKEWLARVENFLSQRHLWEVRCPQRTNAPQHSPLAIQYSTFNIIHFFSCSTVETYYWIISRIYWRAKCLIPEFEFNRVEIVEIALMVGRNLQQI